MLTPFKTLGLEFRIRSTWVTLYIDSSLQNLFVRQFPNTVSLKLKSL